MTRDRIAASFDRAYGGDELFFGASVRPEFAAWCERNPVGSLRVLDAGCGDGRYSLYLAERGAAVTGIDFSKVGLAKLRRAAGLRHLELETALVDLCADALPAGPFDLIAADTVLGHLDDLCRERLAAGFAASLKPGGCLYASVFTVADPGSSELSPTAVHYFAEGELRALFGDLREESYAEFLEESRAHGAPHMHGYAVGFFRKA